MKKKSICILMTAMLVLAVSGCGKKNDTSEMPVETAGNNDEKEVSAAVDEDVKEPVVAETEEKEPEAELNMPASEYLSVNITRYDYTASDEESGRTDIVESRYAKIELSDEDAKRYPELAKTLDARNQEQEKNSNTEFETTVQDYLDFELNYEYGGLLEGTGYYPTYVDEVLNRIIRADENVLSIMEHYYGFLGGAHGFYGESGEAYDVKTGKLLTLEDVVVDKEAFTDKIKDKLLEGYPDTQFAEDLDEYCKNVEFSGNFELNWSIDYSGLTVYFEPYELASYAEGVLVARFSFAEDGDLFNPQYTSVPENYITSVTKWTDAYADLDGDGKEEKITLFGEGMYEDYDSCEWKWLINDKEGITDTCESFENESYLVKYNGKYYAYMFNKVEDDYRILSIIDIATGKELGGEYGLPNYGIYVKDYGYSDKDGVYCYWNTESALINPEAMELESRLDVLGTYSSAKTYSIGSDGIPVSDEEFFEIDKMGYMICPVRDLPCSIVDKDGNVIEENAVLPKDTMLRIVRTDGKTIADLQAGDYNVEETEYSTDEYPFWFTEDPIDLSQGTFYRIEYEEIDYEPVLDGESVYNLFKGMMFAG